MIVRRLTLCLLPVVALSACTTEGTSTGSPLPQFDSYADYDSFGQSLANASASLGFTDPSTLPTSGSATYDGVLGLVFEPGTTAESSAIGTMQMNVLFGENDITGNVTDFIDDSNRAYQGTLTINNGDIDRGADVEFEFTYFADLGGQLTGPSGTMTIDAIMAGDLLGPGTYTEGVLSGFSTDNQGTSPIEGGYIGERRE